MSLAESASPPEPLRPAEAVRLAIAQVSAEQGLSQAFRRLCEIASTALCVDRVGIWLFVDDRRGMRCANLYERQKRQHSEGCMLRVADFPLYFGALGDVRALPVVNATTDPRTCELIPAYLAPLGITSMLDATIVVRGDALGVVCHEHVGPPREWTPSESDLAAALADAVGLHIKAAELDEARSALRTKDEQLAETRRLDALGGLAAGIAHDFRNLLTVVLGAADRLSRVQGLPTMAKDLANQIADAAERGTALTEELTQYARDQTQRPTVVSARETVERFLPLLQAAAGPSHPVEYSRDEIGGKVFLDPTALERLLMNLVVNARDAMPTGGPIRVAVGTETAPGMPDPPRAYARIEVRDAGTGIAPENLDRIFDPFFTTKPAGVGTGLGLAVVKQVVDRAGGFVKVASELGHGTAIRVYLPRVAGEG